MGIKVFIILSVVFSLRGQGINITGFVFEAGTSVPVSNVVISTSSGQRSLSDGSGEFSIRVFEKDTLFFSHILYADTMESALMFIKHKRMYLRKSELKIREVLITGGEEGKRRKVGYKIKKGNYYFNLGYDFVFYLYIPNPYSMPGIIKSIRFKASGGESPCNLILDLYNVIERDGKPFPGKSVSLSEKRFILKAGKEGDIFMEVLPYKIFFPPEGIFVKMGWECLEKKETASGNYFTLIGKTLSRPPVLYYSRGEGELKPYPCGIVCGVPFVELSVFYPKKHNK